MQGPLPDSDRTLKVEIHQYRSAIHLHLYLQKSLTLHISGDHRRPAPKELKREYHLFSASGVVLFNSTVSFVFRVYDLSISDSYGLHSYPTSTRSNGQMHSNPGTIVVVIVVPEVQRHLNNVNRTSGWKQRGGSRKCS
jgi:hypothetical protein